MIVKAIMPNKIRIELVVIFILHLQVVLADGRCIKYESSPFRALLPNCNRKQNKTFRIEFNKKNEDSQDRQFSGQPAFGHCEQLQCAEPNTPKRWVGVDCRGVYIAGCLDTPQRWKSPSLCGGSNWIDLDPFQRRAT